MSIISNKLKLALFLLLCSSFSFAQGSIYINTTFAATGQSTSASSINGAVDTFMLQYYTTGAPGGVSIQIEGDPGSGSFGLCGAAVTVTTSGQTKCVGNFKQVRVNLTTLTGGTAPTVVATLVGNSSADEPTGSAAAQVQGVAPAGTALASAGNPVYLACDTTAAGGVTAGQSQILKCSTTGVLATVLNAGNSDSVTAAEGALEQIGGTSLPLQVAPKLFNGSTTSRPYAASSANLVAASTLTARNSAGSQLTERGSRWVVTNSPAAGSQASASIALEAGVKHVATQVCFSAGSIAAPAATSLQVNIRDGATGAGTVLMTFEIDIPASAGNNQPAFCTGDLNLVGTAGTAMTAEWSALLANLKESVSIIGYNIN